VQKPFVLVADDNEATCTLITALLHHDFVVETASDGTAAIARLKSRQYAAVILDLLMPVADGYAVLDFLRMHRDDLLPRIIVITASVGRREMERVASYGVHRVMPKPFEVDALHATVKEIAGSTDAFNAGGGALISTGMILMLADLLR
jgi:putative two-component system response regulator